MQPKLLETNCMKVRSHSLSSSKNLLHTTFWYVRLSCSYSKTSCMKHRQFSIKISQYCNSVCPGDNKLRELSLNHTVSSPLWVRALVESNVRQNFFFCCGSGRMVFLGNIPYSLHLNVWLCLKWVKWSWRPIYPNHGLKVLYNKGIKACSDITTSCIELVTWNKLYCVNTLISLFHATFWSFIFHFLN